MDKPEKDKKGKEGDETTEKVGYNRSMLDNVLEIGKQRLISDNVKETRLANRKRIQRKRMVNRAVSKVDDAANERVGQFKGDLEIDLSIWMKLAMINFPDFHPRNQAYVLHSFTFRLSP